MPRPTAIAMYIAIAIAMYRAIAIVKAEAKRVRTPPTGGERGQTQAQKTPVVGSQLLTGVHGTQNHNVER